MADTKYTIADRGDVSDQQSLLKKLMKKEFKPVRRIIPGGKTLMDQVDQESLPRAIWTWLRHCRDFTQVTISFSADPDLRSLKEALVMEFDADAPAPIWVTHDEKKSYLANQLADVINRHAPVKVVAKKDGIYVYTASGDDSFDPSSEDWQPYIEFVPDKKAKGEYSLPIMNMFKNFNLDLDLTDEDVEVMEGELGVPPGSIFFRDVRNAQQAAPKGLPLVSKEEQGKREEFRRLLNEGFEQSFKSAWKTAFGEEAPDTELDAEFSRTRPKAVDVFGLPEDN